MQVFSKDYLEKRLLNWKFFLICNFLILLIKIFFSAYNHFAVEYFEDWSIAKNLVTDHIYSLRPEHGSSAYKLPVYPLFLSLYMKMFDLNVAAKFIIITQHIFYFIIPVVLIKFFENFNLKNAGFLSASFFLLSPAYFYYSNVLEATNIFILFFVLWIYVYSLVWIKSSSIWNIVILSGLTALVGLTQVIAIPVMIFLLLILCFYKKISIKNLIFISLISGIFYSPWIIRNYNTFNKIIISKSPVWQNVYLGYLPDHQILFGNEFVSEKDKQNVFDKTDPLNEFEDEKVFKNEVEKIVSHDNMAPYKKGINNLLSLWFVPKRYFDNNSMSILIGRKCYVFFIDILLLLSLIYFFRKNKKLFFILIFLFAGFTMPYLIGHAANIRFKLDFEWIQTSVIALYLYSLYQDKIKSSCKIPVSEKLTHL